MFPHHSSQETPCKQTAQRVAAGIDEEEIKRVTCYLVLNRISATETSPQPFTDIPLGVMAIGTVFAVHG